MHPRIFAATAAAILAAATPALAQESDGERIFRGILEGLLGPQQPAQEQQETAARFDVTDVAGRATCTLIFSGSGDTGTVQPQQGCPGVLATAANWRRVDADLELRNSANQLVWRGQAVTGGWTGGVSDTLRAYTIKPVAAVTGPAAAAAAATFDPATLYGDWRAAEPGQTRGCRVTFVRPDPNNRYAQQNAVRTDRGCPAFVGGATQWFVNNGTLTLANQAGEVLATFTRTSADRWVGMSDDVDVTLTRL